MLYLRKTSKRINKKHGIRKKPNKLKKRPGWSAIDAVKKDQLLIIDADVGSRWGPRIIEFAKAIVEGTVLH